jgi:diguanylate cyclase (GGDEF)-like protein/PAS domain S-box-containing protein
VTDAPAPWPHARVGVLLATLALALGAQETLRPEWTASVSPGVLGVTTLALSAFVLRHSVGLKALAGAAWRSFAGIGGLLGLGQLIRAATGAGVNPVATGLADLPLAATGPVAVLVCVRLVRSTRGRLRYQVVLDAVVALVSLGVLLEVLVRVVIGGSGRAAAPMLTVGYPAVSAVLVAVGLVTFAGVSAPRRAAAGWLLLCFASLAVTMASGALSVGAALPVFDVITSTAYLAVLATATRALAAAPGPQAPDVASTALPLVGVVVTHCLGFGVVLVLLAGWAVGRPLVTVEAVSLTLLMALTFVRTLVWAADGARLTRQVVRAEAYFRTLVHRAADVTIVLDAHGQITWASTSGEDPTGWSTRDLEGRPLREFTHGDDLVELQRALDPSADLEDGEGSAGPVFRLRTRDGAWRRFEAVRTLSSAGLPGDGLVASREGRILHLRDVVGRRSAELELERLAYSDYLTELPNRARLMAALETARTRAAAGEPACLLLLDLDGFKAVNDIAGHEAGDHLLVQVAARLRATVRDRDLIGRLGGDEFAVLVRADLAEATALAERIVTELRTVHPTARAEEDGAALVFDVSGSVGVTELDPADDVATTIRQADLALRAAKVAGKSRVRRHGDAADEATRRRTLLARDLPAAIEQAQLRVVYQPIVGVRERRVFGLEVLVRWEHPILGTIRPDEFLPLAEDDGLIVTLQRWVLRTATTDLAGLLADGHQLQLGVNVSVRHLQAGCLAPDVAQALAASGVPPRNLVLEITESVMLDAEERLENDLTILRGMGCVIALDDFGRGYSSLAYLARLPVDILKMDRGFVADVETDRRGAALVATVIELGRTLGMDVVAEGVETDGQLALLAGMDCRYAQGYLLGRPVPFAELRPLLAAFGPASSTASRS